MSLQTAFQQYLELLREEGFLIYSAALVSLDGACQSKQIWPDDPRCIYSATKTVTSLAFGFAREEGLLDLDRPLLNLFPEYETIAAPGSEAISLRHLLTMTAGKQSFWFGALDEAMRTQDWAELFWQQKQRKAPGSSFFYSNAAFYMVARAVERATGQGLRAYLMPRLFHPLDIWNPLWGTCPGGHQNGASELYLRHEEFLRLGRLLLQDGRWEGRQLVPAAYVREMSQVQVPTTSMPFLGIPEAEAAYTRSGYGFGVWLGPRDRSFRADGKYGQFLLVDPEEGLLLCLMGHEEKRPYRELVLAEDCFLGRDA